MKTIYKNIRFIFLFIGTSLFILPTAAQSVNTEYFMKSSISKTSLNPALRPDQGYVGIPVLSNIFVDYKTNTFDLENFIFPGGPAGSDYNSVTFLHQGVTADQFLKNISDKNYANLDAAITIASVGFYKGDGFWTVDLGVKANVDFNLPYDLFSFAKNGLKTSDGELVSGYDLKDIRGRATSYAELGVGHSRPFLDNKLVVGVKAKLLFGLANADLHVKQLNMNTGIDQWTIESEAALKYSLSGFEPKYDEDGMFNGIEKKGSLGLGGFGLGFDLGATYKLSGLADALNGVIDEEILDRFTLSAALTDIGFISWSSNSSRYLATDPTKTVVTGDFDIAFGGEGKSLGDQISDIGNTLKDAVNLKEADENKGRTTGLKTKMNWGLEYEFIKDQLSAGILSTTQFTPIRNVTEFTLAGTYRPVSWFEAGLSYSFVHSSFNTFGLALNFVPAKGLNLFLASDYITPHVNSDFLPTTSKGLNFQFGLSVPLGGSKRTN